MYSLYRYFRDFVAKNEEGQGTVEYALMIIIVALGAIAGMHTLANQINAILSHAATLIQGAS